jgi:hypothetical protein
MRRTSPLRRAWHGLMRSSAPVAPAQASRTLFALQRVKHHKSQATRHFLTCLQSLGHCSARRRLCIPLRLRLPQADFRLNQSLSKPLQQTHHVHLINTAHFRCKRRRSSTSRPPLLQLLRPHLRRRLRLPSNLLQSARLHIIHNCHRRNQTVPLSIQPLQLCIASCETRLQPS